FQAEDGIRGRNVTGVQTCALPIWTGSGAGDGAALPLDLVERDRAGHGRVQGGGGTADRDLGDHVARLPPTGAHAHGLVPDDDQGGAGEVLRGQLVPSRLVEADDSPS